MREGTSIEPASTGRRRSIVARLSAGLIILSLLLMGFVSLVIWAAAAAQREMARAEQSFQQLETARVIEGAFSRYLLSEISRRFERDRDPDASAEADALRDALIAYRHRISAEVMASGTDTERLLERGEFIRSQALSDLFDAIDTEAVLDRRLNARSDSAESADVFLRQFAGQRDEIFQAVLFEIQEDERSEIEDASAALAQVRWWTFMLGAIVGIAFLVAAILFAIQFRRGLQRPIRHLATATEDFGTGRYDSRVPQSLPGEFAQLADSFNAMAAQLGAQHRALEDQVTARTSDLAEANEELRRIDEARRRFFANVSHELRTPVTVLLGEAQIAKMTAEDPEATREALDRINASGGFLRRRLDDLLKLARSDDGALELSLGPIQFPDPVREAVDLARGYAAASEVELAMDEDEPVQITADAEALRQAALALIDNAIKFSPPGGVVAVTVEIEDSAVRFTVADEGPGFSEEQTAIFDRYAQESAGRAAGGSGLGLAIAKWIAEQHQGSIRAGNRSEGGAAVILEIPR
ncbi:MAG: HAMP domain-containing sensor histidine kinase [Pseudomonadota bacterium]